MGRLVDRVTQKGDRVVINRRGRDVAVIVSMDDLALIERLEDQIDAAAVRESRRNREASIPLDQYLRRRSSK